MDLKPGELYQGLTGLISGHGGQKTGLRVLVWVLNGPGGGTEGRTEGRKDGRLEIPPCVQQDIGPLGPLPKNQLLKPYICQASLHFKSGISDLSSMKS